MKITLHEVTRECGSCTLCCKVMGVTEGDFHKPKDQWCVHASKAHGCGIHETAAFPTKCRDFQCLWLLGKMLEADRPDKVHGVVTPTTDGVNWVIHEDPGYAGHARRMLKPMIDAWLDLGAARYVIVVCGSQRSFMGDVRTFRQLQAREAPEVIGARDITEPTGRV